jgi:glutamate-1-semialdehyde 2,1-aminomutase
MSGSRERSAQLFTEASKVIAGGVSSDARRVSGTPLYVDRAQGAHLWDVDGNRYIDYVLGQGPALLGHCPPAVVQAVRTQVARGIVYSAQHEAEVDLARSICEIVPFAEKVRFNTVGSEAVHAALRLARGVTGRSKILKFEGHYHGWLDPVLYSVSPDPALAGPVGSPVAVAGTKGQQLSSLGDLVIARWNDLESVENALEREGSDIAAVIFEPILFNSGGILPVPGFLEKLVELVRANGSLVIFDEIITGFRLAAGGASEFFGVEPDLGTFGKAVAGGMPLSVLAGRAEYMDYISNGTVAHAGTFNSHPVSVAAANATLKHITDAGPALYSDMFARGDDLKSRLVSVGREAGVPVLADGVGSVFQLYFTDRDEVRNYRDFAATDRARNGAMQTLLAARGINLNSRGLWFMSTEHSEADVDETVSAFADALHHLPQH